ncbi:MAG: hypothetical protein FWC24_03915 [Treponema sp.]|nr:hypothetical protein [Treponema sp.]
MKARFLFIFLYLVSLPLFSQAEIAPGAMDNLAVLLNKPAVANPVKATALGNNWYNVYLDTHMFTDQASFKQIVQVLTDIGNYKNIFDGKSNKLRTKIISRTNNETVVDITSITIAFIQYTVEYRASIITLENTDTRFTAEIRQNDSETNTQIKNYHAIRFIEEITINGKKYTYIRINSRNDTYVGIRLPNIPNTIEKNSVSSNEDILQMIIRAAKTR